jgi:hypothetical protein
MDEIVRKAMAKWPDVPFAYGWLALDARGRWLLKGDPITNPAVVAFIGRNYAVDERGRWYFQNGPQRVFVTLAATPWILSLDDEGRLATHVGTPAGAAREAWLDEAGRVLFVTDVGAGALVDRDLAALVQRLVDAEGDRLDDAAITRWIEGAGTDDAPWVALADGRIRIERLPPGPVGARFGFDPDPRPDAGEPEC